MNSYTHLWVAFVCMLSLPSVYTCISDSISSSNSNEYQEYANFGLEPEFPCGRTIRQHGITGGSVAAGGEFPWQVYLRVRESSSSSNCGGSIILSRWIITAAHCIAETSATYRIWKDGTWYNVIKVIRHPQYRSSNNAYDIALLKLQVPLSYSRTTRPVCLLADGQKEWHYTGKTVTASGYGVTDSGSTSDYLRKARMKIISFSLCRAYYNSVSSSVLCASRITGETCSGDSGGPLTYLNTEFNVYQLFGVTSFGDRTCGARPTGFTSLFTSGIEEWIEKYVTVTSTTRPGGSANRVFAVTTAVICLFV